MKAKYKITDIALKENMFVNCTIHLKRVGRGFLTDQKIQKIMDNEFDSNRLEWVRDVFIFSGFTGFAYIDVEQLTASNIFVLLLMGNDG